MDVLSLHDIAVAALGGAIALSGQGIWRRLTRLRTARTLARAYQEEISAVQFGGDFGQRFFGGFSSQVFDTLFRETCDALPEAMTRRLMRYHWRMKFLQVVQDADDFGFARQHQEFVLEAESQRSALLRSLQAFQAHDLNSLFWGSADEES